MSVEAPDIDDPSRLIGEILASRYQIEHKLGEGAMGAVFKARHVKVGRPFAVKVLHPRLTVDTKLLQRFEREAELAGRLHHPNVIGVVDVGETADGMRYMVMDFAEGPDLASLLGEAPMAPERIIALVRQMLEGLYHAHQQGLVHRDFKPENVIIEHDTHGAEVPRIVDFGIAILREGGDSTEGPGRLTTNGLVLGTPHYMAPEQAVADAIDHRIDLFALGIVIYEMLCGKLPFDGTGVEVARANLLADPPKIAERVPGLEVDPLLEAFSRRLMAKKADDRPANAKAARELLDLIERDRDAAAKALDVPLAVRTPQPTVDSKPIRPVRDDYPGTFPPPIAEAEAEAPGAPVAVATGEPGRGDAPRTEPADPLPYGATPARSRRGLVVGAIAGLGALGIVTAVLLGRSHGGADASSPAGAGAPSGGTPVAAAEPTPAPPTPAPPTPAAPTPAAPTPGSPAPDVTPPPAAPPTETGSAATEHAATEHAATEHATSAHRAGRPGTKKPPKDTSHPGTTASAATKPATKPAEPQPAVAKPAEPAVAQPAEPAVARPLDAAALAAEYQAVGSQLKALDQAKGADAASDLWARYRLIRITDAMSTQPKRDAAASILRQLRATARQRSR